jgi:hypothetical protein
MPRIVKSASLNMFYLFKMTKQTRRPARILFLKRKRYNSNIRGVRPSHMGSGALSSFHRPCFTHWAILYIWRSCSRRKRVAKNMADFTSQSTYFHAGFHWAVARMSAGRQSSTPPEFYRIYVLFILVDRQRIYFYFYFVLLKIILF